MPVANPRRNVNEESVRIQEFTGGFRPREMMGDYEPDANADADGLAHHSRESGESAMRDQLNPKKRREKALKEMEGELPHISIKPEKIADTLASSPQSKDESMLAESRTGVDMGLPGGLSASTGAQISPVMREGPGLLFGRSEDIVESVWGRIIKITPEEAKEFAHDEQSAELQGAAEEQFGRGIPFASASAAKIVPNPNEPNEGVMRGGKIGAGIEFDDLPDNIDEMRAFVEQLPEEARSLMEMFRQQGEFAPDDVRMFLPTPPQFEMEDERRGEATGLPRLMEQVWQEKNASADPPLTSDIIKAKRKKKGRKYEEDEESEEDERKSKRSKKRKRKRKMKQGKKEASRDIKGKTARRAASAEQNLDRGTKRQAFGERRMFSGNPRASSIPLRLRDPIAYQRKLANEKMRREQGALPRDITVHRDTSGLQGKIQTIGMNPSGTKMGASAPKGTSMNQFKPSKGAKATGSLMHDPLAAEPLMKAKGLTRLEISDLKRQLDKLVKLIEGIKKSPPVFEENAKRGAQASPARASSTADHHLEREEDKPAYRFEDTSIPLVTGVVGKR